ncbi:helix-turn-helix domain-containing protein [Streptomyces sp. NBRC 109706]|uniref:helix-turn-helix domain-containing protein n=1 Tax=Streptomyces sp. NBRC 109706 TaxID=1550035 RepID=UPI0007814ED3|nr:helix-turn-helix domain-containing protein [Streptomyces sp. NBRC 109706]
MTTTMSPHLTVSQLAARWHTDPKGIYNLRQRGKTPPAMRRGRILLFPLAEVEAHERRLLDADSQRANTVEMRPAEPLARIPRQRGKAA